MDAIDRRLFLAGAGALVAGVDELAEKGDRYLGLFRETQGPNAVAALQETKIVMPDSVYNGTSTQLDLGGRTAELRAHGLAHTRGDQTVYLPRERILFAGDLIDLQLRYEAPLRFSRTASPIRATPPRNTAA